MDLKDLSSFVTAAIALYGLGAWRAQSTGKRKIELAEQALARFYEAQDALRHIRSPLAFTNEQDAGEKGEGESNESYEARRMASVVFVRNKEYSELFSRLHAMRYEFAAVFGVAARKPFDDFHQLHRSVSVSAHMLGRLWGSRDFDHAGAEAQNRRREMIQRHEEIFWQIEEDDRTATRMAEIVISVEAFCRPVMEPRTWPEKARHLIEKLQMLG